MASKNRILELRAKFRDDASKNAKRLADALKVLSDDAQQTSNKVRKSNDAFSDMASDLAKLQTQAGKLQAFGTVAGELDKARGAVERLATGVQASEKSLLELATQSQRASAAARESRAALDAEEAALRSNRQARDDAKQGITAQKREIKSLEAELRKLDNLNDRNSLNTDQGMRRSQLQTQILPDANNNLARLERDLVGYREEIKKLEPVVKSLRAETSSLGSTERSLENQVKRASNSLRGQREALAQGQQDLTQLDGAAREGSVSLGGLAANQQDVERATARMNDRIKESQRLIETYQKFATGSGDFADPQTAARLRKQNEIIRQSEQDWKALEAEVKRVATEMRAMGGSTAEQEAAMRRAIGASRAAKAEYQQQVQVLHQLRGATQTTFAEFAARTNPLRASTQAASAAVAGLATNTSRAANEQMRLAPAVTRTANAMGTGAQRTDAFSNALLGVGRNGRQALSYMERLRGEIIAFTLSYVGFQEAVNQIGQSIEAFRALEALQSRLGAVFDQDTARVSQEVDFLRGQADRLGIAVSTLGDTYGKFAVAADAANFSQQSTRDIFLSVAEAARVNKLSMDQMKGTFVAIEQIISKGKFTSEEVRRQLGDRLPGAFNILADAMGVTTAELDKMMSQGDLLATESNLSKFAQEMTNRFGPQLSSALDTLNTDIGRFENNVFKAQLALADGLVPGLRQALQAFDEFVNSEKGRETFAAIGSAVGSLISVLAEVPGYFDEIVLAAKVFASLKLAGLFVNLTGRIAAFRRSFVGIGQEMAFIGPQMQQMTFLQRNLGQAFAQSVGNIDRWRAALAGATASTAASRTGLLAMRGALGLVRGAMLATANVARTLWSALGGPVGIAVTALTFAVGEWMTSVDDATSAISEHRRQVQAVREAYAVTKGEVDEFAESVKGVTLNQAEENLRKLEETFRDRVSKISATMRDLFEASENWDVPFLREQAQNFYGEPQLVQFVGKLREATEQFTNLEISADEYRSVLDELGRSTDSVKLDELLTTAANMLDRMEEGGDSITSLSEAMERQRSVVKALKGDTSDFNDEVDEGVEKVVDYGKAFREFEMAARKLKGEISEFAEEMDDLDDKDALKKMYQDAVKLARNMSQVVYLTNLYNKALGEIEDRKLGRIFDGAGTNPGFTAKVIGVESAGDASARNPNSTATGLGQFIESTWISMFQKYFPERAAGMTREAILALRENGELSAQMVEFYARENANALRSAGKQINDATLYLAHFLGAQGAIDVLNADPSTPLESLFGEDVISANENVMRGKTAGDIIALTQRKMGMNTVELELLEAMSESEKERLETLQEQEQATQDLLKQNAREIELQRLANSGKEREAEIQRAIADAREDNPDITEEQIAQLREQAGVLWDMQNSTKARELAEERVNQLYNLRQQLLEQQKIAQENGDTAMANSLGDRISGVNDQLREAISNAIAMWKAIGGPEADAAIAKLQTMEMSLEANASKAIIFGLNMSQVQSLVGGFVDGLVGAFDSFAQSVSQGQNAIQALWNSFLQFAADFLRQISLMIIKQMLLNALAGFGGPIGQAASALGGMTGHTGGVVGSAAIGGGNAIGRPAWASPQFVYHTGGVAGLRPDEVSATLRKGEEILTEEDPRHRNNLGGERDGGMSGARLNQVLAVGDDEIANAMKGKHGEDVMLTHIKRNASKITRLLNGGK